jgi:hypothetical protein
MRIENAKLSYAGIVKRQLGRLFATSKKPEVADD